MLARRAGFSSLLYFPSPPLESPGVGDCVKSVSHLSLNKSFLSLVNTTDVLIVFCRGKAMSQEWGHLGGWGGEQIRTLVLSLSRRGPQLQGPVHGLTAAQWSRSGSPGIPSPPSFSCWVKVPVSSLESKATGLPELCAEGRSFSALSSTEVNVPSSSSGACCSWRLPLPLLCSPWLINFRCHLRQQPGNTVPAWSSVP